MDTPKTPAPVFVVSGGIGASGEQLVHTVLAQFPESGVPLEIVSRVRTVEQVENVVARAKASGGTIVHTLVDKELRTEMRLRAHNAGIIAIDLMGPLLNRLERQLGREPLGQPGRYRELHRQYYERVEAIEYTMAHNDGKDPPGWPEAEIVLSGVSRTGKTPLALYLSVLGWKVANVPLVPVVKLPEEFFRLDRRRVIGLTIEPGALIQLRQQRQARLGAPGPTDYTQAVQVFEEVQAAEDFFRKLGIRIIDVTSKSIETTADEVIRLINLRVG